MQLSFWRGIAAASVVVMIWSGWVVISKLGVDSAMNIADLAALRYMVAGGLSAPFVLYYRAWRRISLWRTACLAATGGVPYVLLAYAGFAYAPASHGGIFINGLLPLITLMLGAWFMAEPSTRWQWFGAVAILVGLALPLISVPQALAADFWVGDGFFAVAATIFSIYVLLNRRWGMGLVEILWALSVFSALVYLPIWFLFLPTEIHLARSETLWLQGLYQGILPNMVGVLMLSVAVRHIGAASTSAMLSLVPAVAAILSTIWLQEAIGISTWVGIALLTAGILLTVLARPKSVPESSLQPRR